MANVREQVMFHLEIQTANVPGDEFIVTRKINSGVHLVDGPIVLHLAFFIRDRVRSSFNRMGQLEDHAQYEPAYQMHGDKAAHENTHGIMEEHHRAFSWAFSCAALSPCI